MRNKKKKGTENLLFLDNCTHDMLISKLVNEAHSFFDK